MVPVTEPATPTFQIRQLQEHRIPVVLCHRTIEGVRAPLLELPYERIGSLAGEALVGRGHRRVAFLATHFSAAAEQYRAGLQVALDAEGVKLRDEDTWWGSARTSTVIQESEIASALDTLLMQRDRPTAIFTTFDSHAEAICLHLESIGLRVPDDISLVSVGGTWRETPMLRRLSSVVVDESATASRAVELLTEMRQGSRPFTDDERLEIPVAYNGGQTVGPAP